MAAAGDAVVAVPREAATVTASAADLLIRFIGGLPFNPEFVVDTEPVTGRLAAT
jgi:hypothetical protein